MTVRTCRIRRALGQVESCPGGACPFWEEGGALLDAGCGLERRGIDLDRPDLAAYLDGLRRELELARDATEREAARRAFAELVPPDLSGR